VSPPGTSSFLQITDFQVFRRQESSLILLNLSILALLILVQVLFLPVVGTFPKVLILLFAGRFIEQSLEFLWLQGRTEPVSPRVTYFYSRLSVWAHVGFAFLVTLISEAEDSHYWVLMVLPIVSAAFRFTWLGTLLVALMGGVFNLFQVWFHYRGLPGVPGWEYFEAATMLLLLLVVAGVVWLLASYLREEEGRLRESLCALERAQKALVAKEKMAAIGRLASSIAHEIRNPVGMIVSSIAMVKQQGLQGPQKQEICDILLSESRRLEQLSNDFLAYASAREPKRRNTLVRSTLECVAGLAAAQMEERGKKIAIACPDTLEGYFDPFQIQQALLNLLVNASDACTAGSEIVMRAEASNANGVNIQVENPTGSPICEEARAQLFEPFFTTKPGGTGLGLCIARNIAHAHQGDLNLVCNERGRVAFELALGGKDESCEQGKPNGTSADCR